MKSKGTRWEITDKDESCDCAPAEEENERRKGKKGRSRRKARVAARSQQEQRLILRASPEISPERQTGTGTQHPGD